MVRIQFSGHFDYDAVTDAEDLAKGLRRRYDSATEFIDAWGLDDCLTVEVDGEHIFGPPAPDYRVFVNDEKTFRVWLRADGRCELSSRPTTSDEWQPPELMTEEVIDPP